jgi:hypothetical protein
MYPPDSDAIHYNSLIFLNKLKSGGLMYTYELLETGCYYLVKEKEESPVKMIQVAVESDHCLYIQHFDNPAETSWKMKKETLFDIIECLTDETVQAWRKHYNIPSEDIFYEDEDE